MKHKNILTKAAALLIVALFSLTDASATTSVRLTVNDGTATNYQVPVYGAQVGDNCIRSQFIIPSAELSGMAGGQITSLIFYANEEVVNWYSEAKFDVYLYETDDTDFGSGRNIAYKTTSGNNFAGTKVYSGNLAINGNQLIITLTTSFTYSGNKNLLIGIRQTAKNSNNTSTFVGVSATNGSVAGTNKNNNNLGTPAYQDFQPKTTFVFFPGYTPTNVTVSNITYESADVTWQSTADSYVVRYRTNRVGYSENFDSGIPSTWRVIKNGTAPDDYSNGWGARNGMATSYSWYDSDTYNADNWLISPAVELGGTLKYDAQVAAWHDIYEVKLCTADIAQADLTINDFSISLRDLTPGITGTEDIDLAAYTGQTGYIAFHHKNTDGHYLNIDNFEVSAGHAWKEVTTTENSAHLTGLVRDSEYEIIIISSKEGVEGGAKTSSTYFTTPNSDAPVLLANAENNEDMIYDLNGKTYNVQLTGRTFKKNGNWNSICLPFDVTLAGSPLEGAEVGTLSSTTTLVNDKLTVRVDPVSTTTLTAGTPYLLRWESGDNIVEPVFENVTITRGMNDVTYDLGEGKSITFKGNYNALKFTAVDKSVLFINNNKVYYVGVNSTINSQRAYFKIEGDEGGSVKQMVLDLGEDGATGIETIDNVAEDGLIYNVAGQRLQKMQKGINIVNGKKILK
ncbi:MAG: choice-of-anchor J domain-containing protein [Bacteroidaceae bacterium]|nr:choice-of-anchor J domain-containing protein [Bacteroidaceae bacterium]